MLQCVIRPKRGDEIKKTAEITGDRKSHLSSLSANLSQMQSEVNAFLTELVEEEKAEKINQPGGGKSTQTTSESGRAFPSETIDSGFQQMISLCVYVDMEEDDGDDGSAPQKEPAYKKPKTS